MRQRVCLCVSVCVSVCLCKWVSVFVMMSRIDKAWICSAEEFLELYGKVEAVVRNYLLRWSGHLFEVPSTHIFDQCFCYDRAFFCRLLNNSTLNKSLHLSQSFHVSSSIISIHLIPLFSTFFLTCSSHLYLVTKASIYLSHSMPPLPSFPSI